MTMLHLKDIILSFPGSTDPILKKINYKIYQHDFVILLGSNGSGKSTLLKLLYRQYHADTGEILFFDKDIAAYSPKEFSQKVAVLTQNCSDSLFDSLTIYENYLLVKQSTSHHKMNRAHEKAFLTSYLTDFNVKLANKLTTPVNQLSGGEKQALTLAFCLLTPPALLLLDEHTSALDPKTSEQIMRLTQKKILQHSITCILTTHDLDIALRYGNRILMLNEGSILKIFDNKEKANLTREDLIACYYT